MATKKWWRADVYNGVGVRSLEVTKTTDKRLYYLRGGVQTWTDKKGWFENWAEAHDRLVERIQARLKTHEEGLIQANKDLLVAMELKEPK